MGFPWYIKEKGWDNMSKSLDLYFARIEAPNQCGILWGKEEELFVFEYDNMKFGDGEGNYYTE